MVDVSAYQESKLRLLKYFSSNHVVPNRHLTNILPILFVFSAVSVISVGILNQFLFGEKLLLFTDIGSDTYYSYYAFYFFLSSYLSDFSLPFWSFKLGTGSSVISLFQFLYDPFSIVYYIVGPENISRSIVWVFVLKTFCAAAFTYLYLRVIGIDKFARIVVSILFAFNGFLMVWGQHFFFASWVVFLPLLFYTIELWLRSDKWLPLTLVVSFMALNIAIFFQVSVFVCLYLLFKVAINPGRDWYNKLTKFVGIYALGLGISAVLWLPEYYLIKSSPRISADLSSVLGQVVTNFTALNTPEYYWSLLARVFSNNLQGIGSEYKGFLNYYESIQLYAGVLPLLLLPQLYTVFSTKEKIFASLALLIIGAFLISPGFSQIMNGFQYPMYRWGYNVVMFELVLAALILNSMLNQGKINVSVLAGAVFSLILCLTYLNIHSQSLGVELYKVAVLKTFQIALLIILYGAALYFLIKVKDKRWAFSLLLILICSELILEHRDSFVARNVNNKGIEQNRSVHYFDYASKAAQEIRGFDSSFYRVEKNHWILSLNDSLVQGYFGLDTYNSLINPGYMNFAKEFDYSHSGTTIKWNSLDNQYLADILSVKYHLTKNKEELPKDASYLAEYGDVSVYLRNSHLPFGFTYDSFISPEVFSQLNKEDRGRALLRGALLIGEHPIEMKEVRQLSTSDDETKLRSNLKKDVLKIVKIEEDRIQGSIRLDSNKLLFLSIPFEHGWRAYVNGQEKTIHKINIGFSGLYLAEGDNNIELRYIPPYMKTGAMVSLLCLLLVILLLINAKKSTVLRNFTIKKS